MRSCRWLAAMLAMAGAVAAFAQEPPAPATAAEFLARAELEASRLRDPAQRALALAEVAVALQRQGNPRWEKLWASALAGADGVTEPLPACLLWSSLAVRQWPLSPGTARSMFERALKMAGELPYAAHKSLALREIGRALIGLDDKLAASTLEQAAQAARTIATPLFQAAALRDLADVTAGLDPARAGLLFAEAAGLLPPASPDEAMQLARVELAVVWSRHDLPAALDAADLLSDPRLLEVCLRRMCAGLGAVNPDGALTVIARIKDPVERPLALASLGAALAATQPEVAAGMARAALADVEKLPAEERQLLQAEAAVALAPQGMAEALALLQQVEDEKIAGEALRRIIIWLSESRPEEALEILESVEDWEAREQALIQILPALATHDMKRATALSMDLLSRRERVQALLVLAAVAEKRNSKP